MFSMVTTILKRTFVFPSFKRKIYLFLAVLGLHCYKHFSLVVASRGYSPVALLGLLIAVASLVAKIRP